VFTLLLLAFLAYTLSALFYSTYSAPSLTSPAFTARLSVLHEGLAVSRPLGRYWTTLSLVRWTLVAPILVCLREYCFLQIMTIHVLVMLTQMMVVHGRPYVLPSENRMAVFNEVMCSVYLYLLLVISMGEVPGVDPEQYLVMREYLGQALVSVIGISFAVNITKMLI
jgi:hypothetical protein